MVALLGSPTQGGILWNKHITLSLAARFMPGRQVLSDAEGAAYGVGSHEGVGYWHDCSEAVLLTSRGGTRCDRTFMEALVRPGPDRRNWTSRSFDSGR